MSLTDINTLLTGSTEEKIKTIERLTSERLAVLLSEEEVPEKFNYIITNVALKRFARLENEGMKSYSQEGVSYTFEDNDFKEFATEIDAYKLEKQKEADSSLGVVRFF